MNDDDDCSWECQALPHSGVPEEKPSRGREGCGPSPILEFWWRTIHLRVLTNSHRGMWKGIPREGNECQKIPHHSFYFFCVAQNNRTQEDGTPWGFHKIRGKRDWQKKNLYFHSPALILQFAEKGRNKCHASFIFRIAGKILEFSYGSPQYSIYSL